MKWEKSTRKREREISFPSTTTTTTTTGWLVMLSTLFFFLKKNPILKLFVSTQSADRTDKKKKKTVLSDIWKRNVLLRSATFCGPFCLIYISYRRETAKPAACPFLFFCSGLIARYLSRLWPPPLPIVSQKVLLIVFVHVIIVFQNNFFFSFNIS